MKNYLLKINKLLEDKKITKIELSELIGKNKNTVSNYFTERTKIDVETIIKIAKVLNVPVSYFFDDPVNSGVNNHIVGNNNINNTQGSVITKNNEIDKLKIKLESCQELVDELRQRLVDKDELIELLRNK